MERRRTRATRRRLAVGAAANGSRVRAEQGRTFRVGVSEPGGAGSGRLSVPGSPTVVRTSQRIASVRFPRGWRLLLAQDGLPCPASNDPRRPNGRARPIQRCQHTDTTVFTQTPSSAYTHPGSSGTACDHGPLNRDQRATLSVPRHEGTAFWCYGRSRKPSTWLCGCQPPSRQTLVPTTRLPQPAMASSMVAEAGYNMRELCPLDERRRTSSRCPTDRPMAGRVPQCSTGC
jgi:hypothetical protein